VWSDLAAVVFEAGIGLVGPMLKALRAGDAERAAQAARVVAETIAFKRILKAARR
jgi:uncharacterized membrane protein